MRKPEADEFVFFWGGVLSNFHPIGGDESLTSEKIYMAFKAAAFRDHHSLQTIRLASTPKAAKGAGRKVEGFNEDDWNNIKVQSMMMALDIKYHTCEEFRIALFDSGTKNLVEASPFDRIWGIGFKEADALANVDKWGQNLLGECLMDLRFQKLGL